MIINIPRYLNEKTTEVGKFHCLNTFCAGTMIDIFILDPVPDDIILQKEFIGKLQIYSDYIMPYYGYTNRADDKYLKEYFEYKELEKKVGKEGVINKLENELFSYKEDECDSYVLRWGSIPHVFKKSMFDKPVYFDFEDIKIPLPNNWFDYLVQLYGIKWMYIPKNLSAESSEYIVDMNYKYTNYLIDSDRFIPKEDALSIYDERKDIFVKNEGYRRPLNEKILNATSEYVLFSQNNYLNKNNVDIENLFEVGDYNNIIKHFDKYISYQFSNIFIGSMNHTNTYRYQNQKFIPLDDRLLYILIYSFIMTGQLDKGYRLIKLRKSYKSFEGDLKDIYDSLLLIYDSIKAFYVGDYDSFNNLLKIFTNLDFLNIYEIDKLRLIVNLSTLDNENLEVNINELKLRIINESLDNEYLKILGDYYYKQGDIEQAKNCYKKSMVYLTNGMMLFDINEKFPELNMNYNSHDEGIKLSGYHYKQLELLRELDEFCKQNNINYILSNETLLYGYKLNTFSGKLIPSTVMMLPEDAYKFIKTFNKSRVGNRSLDYILNNPDYSDYSICYCDNNTFVLNWLNSKVKNKCMHIKIEILKRKPTSSFQYNLLKFMKKIKKIHDKSKTKNKRSFKKYIACFLFDLFGKERFSRVMFNLYIKASKKNSNNKYYITKKIKNKNKNIYFDNSYFNNLTKINVCGYEFNAPSNIKDFLFNIFGKQLYNDLRILNTNLDLMKIYECDMSYDEFKNNVDTSFIKKEDFDQYKKGQALDSRRKKLNKEVVKYWNIIKRGGDRFKLYIQYKPLKKQIMDLYGKGDFENLKIILSDYDKKVRINMRNNMGICFDYDIFKVYCDLLIYNGENVFEKRLNKCIPKEHKEKIVIQS